MIVVLKWKIIIFLQWLYNISWVLASCTMPKVAVLIFYYPDFSPKPIIDESIVYISDVILSIVLRCVCIYIPNKHIYKRYIYFAVFCAHLRSCRLKIKTPDLNDGYLMLYKNIEWKKGSPQMKGIFKHYPIPFCFLKSSLWLLRKSINC